MKARFLIALIGLAIAAGSVGAQRYGHGPGWGGYSYHASTAGEGYMRGMSDVIRSQGMRNLMNSEAAKNMEDARTKYIDNRLRGTQTYFEMKRVNKEYKDATQKPRPTSEQLFRLAKQSVPKTLTPSELDPVTGKVAWPAALQQPGFQSYRQQVDQLLAARVENNGKLNLQQSQAAVRAISDMQIELKRRIQDIPPQVFGQTNAFLKRLQYLVRKDVM